MTIPDLDLNMQGLLGDAGQEFTSIFGTFWPIVAFAAALPGIAAIFGLIGMLARMLRGGRHDADD